MVSNLFVYANERKENVHISGFVGIKDLLINLFISISKLLDVSLSISENPIFLKVNQSVLNGLVLVNFGAHRRTDGRTNTRKMPFINTD